MVYNPTERKFLYGIIEKHSKACYNYIITILRELLMREGTSDFWVTQSDGKTGIGYEDYGVSQFGGGDLEKTY